MKFVKKVTPDGITTFAGNKKDDDKNIIIDSKTGEETKCPNNFDDYSVISHWSGLFFQHLWNGSESDAIMSIRCLSWLFLQTIKEPDLPTVRSIKAPEPLKFIYVQDLQLLEENDDDEDEELDEDHRLKVVVVVVAMLIVIGWNF